MGTELAMPTEFEKHCETIEECYEYTLSYAARGHRTDEGSAHGEKLRSHLTRSVHAMRNLESSCAAIIASRKLEPAAPYEAFFAVLARDAASSIAAIEMVLAQPAIGSQLIDNLNASVHLRALLTDIFLVAEILESRQTRLTASQHEVL